MLGNQLPGTAGKNMSNNDRKSFISTRRGKHNRTPTQAHTSRYSRHLRHALESAGLHRRYKLALEIQRTILRGAGAGAHERRTDVVAAEGAAAKGHCPRCRHAHARSLVSTRTQQQSMLGTDRRTLQLVVVQMKRAVSRRNRELDHQLSGILRKPNKQTCILVCLFMYVCMRSESESASHSSPPQLKGVRVISACVCVLEFVLILFR